MSNQERYVVTIGNDEIDIWGKISSLKIVEKRTEEDNSKGCLSAVAKIVVAIIDFPTMLMDAFMSDMNRKQRGGSCGSIMAIFIGRFVWITVLIGATYGIVPLLYLICLGLGAIDTKKNVFVCSVELLDGRSFRLSLDETDHKRLSDSISSDRHAPVVSKENYAKDQGEKSEDIIDVVDIFLSRREKSEKFKLLTEKLFLLAECKKSNLIDETGFGKKLAGLELDFLSYELKRQLEEAKSSGLLNQAEYEESKAKLEAKDSWEIDSQLLLAKAFQNMDPDVFEERVMYWVKRSSETDHAFAKLWLGELYYFDEDTIENKQAALRCFLDAYELGSENAAEWLSDFYEEGVCVEKDAEMADWYYERALLLAKK